MDQILAVRSKIYDQFHGSNAGPDHFFKDDHAEAYAAYYTAMYLIQDAGESVWSHMNRGFSSDPLLAYIEFWGVMQAIFIQQDAIKELYQAVTGSKLPIPKEDSEWSKIRDVRNLCAGHPAKRAIGGHPAKRAIGVPAIQRTFMGRCFGHYGRIQYELWDARAATHPSHPAFNLGAMIKAYDAEGAQALNTVLCALVTKWPKTVSVNDTPGSAAASVSPGLHIVMELDDDLPAPRCCEGALAKVDGSPQMPDNPCLFSGGQVEPITGTLSVTEEPDSLARVAPHEAFLSAAVGLMRGAIVLAAAPASESAWAFALVSGQIMESSLKAFLAKARPELDLQKIGHDLSTLWARAAETGLPISAAPPDWAETLISLHAKPYYIRYPMGLHGLVLPNAQNTTSELQQLIATCASATALMSFTLGSWGHGKVSKTELDV